MLKLKKRTEIILRLSAAHLVQVEAALEQELGPPLLLPKTGKGLPVRAIHDAAFPNGGLAVAGEVGVFGGRGRGSRQDAAGQLLLQARRDHVQQVVHVQSLILRSGGVLVIGREVGTGKSFESTTGI